MSLNRRKFLKTTLAGVAGSALLTGADKTEILDSMLPLSSRAKGAGDERYWQLVRKQFRFIPGLHYFNNASLGPSPAYVTDAAAKFRQTLESFPSKYMWGGWHEEIEQVRIKAASMFNALPEEIALNHNTSEGLSLVAHSLQLQAGDQVILSDHAHLTAINPFRFYQESKGVKLVRPKLPLLPESKEEIVEVFTRAISDKTRMIVLSHMVNTNGMILPVKEICEIAKARGILTLVDGAQTPGMIKVDVKDIGCDFYATSGHKWMMGPKGTGIFYARLDKQNLLTPIMAAKPMGEDKGARRFENYNTRNLPDVLALGSAIDFHNLLGEKEKAERILYLKSYLLKSVAQRPYLKLRMPVSDELSAGICSVEVAGKGVVDVAVLLDKKYKIALRPMPMLGINGLRVSTSICITPTEIDKLIKALDVIHAS
jgi:selenocysteine lyase/cysteine desulfurase